MQCNSISGEPTMQLIRWWHYYTPIRPHHWIKLPSASRKRMSFCCQFKDWDRFQKSTQSSATARNVAMTGAPAAELDFPAYVSASAKVAKGMNKLYNARIRLVQFMVEISTIDLFVFLLKRCFSTDITKYIHNKRCIFTLQKLLGSSKTKQTAEWVS